MVVYFTMPTSAKEFAEYSDDSFASNVSEDELKLHSPKGNPKKKKKKVSKNVRVKKPPSPYGQPMRATGPKKTSEELWIEGMHRGQGLTASVKSSNYLGLTGKKTVPGGNCSDYLREAVLGLPAKSRRSQSAMDDTFTRSTKGVPVYKPQEDMYDDILELRKTVTVLKQESELIKARHRRLEDDNKMKEKYIDELMMASRTGDMKMTSSGKIIDPNAKIVTLKQRNVKLEMAVKEKENALKKLHEDMKCTNIEEMKIAMETFYQEVQRLRIEQSENEKLSRSMKQSGNNNAKLKALNGTVLRLTEANQRMQSENKLLKLDLERAMDKSSPRSGGKGGKGDYKDMDRQNLLATINKLEKEVEEAKGREIKNSVAEANKRQLMETIEKHEKDNKRLKEEKSKLRKTIDEQEQEIKDLNGKLKKITAQILKESEEAAARSKLTRQSSSDSIQRTTPRSRSGSTASLKRAQKKEEIRLEEQKRKAQELRKNNSAKSIQRNWRAHKKLKEEEEELNAATVAIQSAYRGHESRKKHLQQLNRYTPSPVNKYDKDYSDEEEEDSGMEDVAMTIQSAARGHWGRKKQMNSYSARNSEVSDAESVSSKRSARSNKSNKSNASKKQEKSKKQIARNYLDDSDDSSDALVTSKPSRNNSRNTSRNASPRPASVKSSSSKKSVLDDSDEDSDEVVVATPKRRSYQFGR
ncbi:uncharacterized protein [Antedon mediterranea]|uniref:uncharacterized protein isoform X2 n=1 Tax=Antedon mediterranea TaxID=105859 RepID=UPI003AF6F358